MMSPIKADGLFPGAKYRPLAPITALTPSIIAFDGPVPSGWQWIVRMQRSRGLVVQSLRSFVSSQPENSLLA